ncbi:MAG: TRAP transporter small permease [Lachnospiraceae bacterium]|nr:TRAP transporter small permease [Lachnospiraceae bacterium]
MEQENNLKKLDKIYAGYSILTKVCNAVGILAVYAMMFIIVIDVFFRNFMPSPLTGIYEIVQWFLLPLSCIPFFGYAYASGIMPRVTMAVEKFKPSVQNKISIFVLILNIIMFSFLAYAGWVYAVKQMGKGGVVTIGKEHVAVWPLFFVIVVAYIMVTIECVFATIKNIKCKERSEVIYND